MFEAVVAHARLLGELGHEPVVFALADEFTSTDRPRFGDIAVQAFPVTGPRMFGYAPGMTAALRAAELDILHLHGIWMYPSAAASSAAAAHSIPYVISPHGMLDPWILRRGTAKKAVAKLGYEKRSWSQANCFHALTDAEAQDIRSATGRGESIVIPNAVPLAYAPEARSPIVAYLGRIHPKKNIAALVAGWQQARDVLRPLGARLLIAGWGEPAHVADLEALLAADACDDIAFLGPLYGEAKAEFLASARFCALASHSEGLPVTILEAWAAGTPSIMSQFCHLEDGFVRGAAIDSGTSPDDIAQALRLALALSPPRWTQMSAAAVALIRETFSPDVIANRWTALYDQLASAQVERVAR